ncbi:MAG: AmmeMemoRadiSam system protein B [Candidatus Thermoplasmatota archaeon]|nr:AmmeMemoRadiSam system protein B [Candidatus Thermoplasmatota archaeon]
MNRKPSVAGMFYPAGRDDLSGMIDQLLSRSRDVAEFRKIIGVIVPHAGYIYSGYTASFAFNAIKKDGRRKFVLVGPKHSGYPYGTYFYPEGAWETPLGSCKIDEDALNYLHSMRNHIRASAEAFGEEHSIEVQVPWLQYIYKEDCEILPISMGDQSLERAEELAPVLEGLSQNRIIVASSDLTHYEPARMANAKDSDMIKAIESLDVASFYTVMERINASTCGYGPIASLMLLTRKLGGKMKLLNHSNSGDSSGDYSSVVGYASFVAYQE